jgi:uncharacterized Zn finger protein|tara:strand:+ start:115 stop:330 length:216 start_codon:yes stop_codon:yes gene_type:complete
MEQKLNVDLNQAETVACESCAGEFFTPVFMIKKLSALVSPTGQDAMLPIQTFRCAECGKSNQEFLAEKSEK